MRYHPFRHLGLKILAIALASLLWLTVAGEHVVERSLRVPLEFRNIPEALEIVGNPPDTVDVGRWEIREHGRSGSTDHTPWNGGTIRWPNLPPGKVQLLSMAVVEVSQSTDSENGVAASTGVTGAEARARLSACVESCWRVWSASSLAPSSFWSASTSPSAPTLSARGPNPW